MLAEMHRRVLPFALARDNTAALNIVGDKTQIAWRTWHRSNQGRLLH